MPRKVLERDENGKAITPPKKFTKSALIYIARTTVIEALEFGRPYSFLEVAKIVATLAPQEDRMDPTLKSIVSATNAAINHIRDMNLAIVIGRPNDIYGRIVQRVTREDTFAFMRSQSEKYGVDHKIGKGIDPETFKELKTIVENDTTVTYLETKYKWWALQKAIEDIDNNERSADKP